MVIGSSISLLEVCILESSYDVVIFCTLKFCLNVKIIRQKKKSNSILVRWEVLELSVIYFFCVMKSTKKCNLFSYFFHWYNLRSSCISPYILHYYILHFFSIFGALWCKAEFFFLPHFFFSCWRVVISLLIEIKPNYLMWSWYWFDFRNQDIFLNWILEALSLGTKAEAPTVLPCSTVVSKTKKSLIMGV